MQITACSSVPGAVSYSGSVGSRSGRLLVRALEGLSGRARLLRMSAGYQAEIATGLSFWEAMQVCYRIEIDLDAAGIANIPADGPVVVVANHPYGILDGLAMGSILSAARGHFRILAHSVFRRAEDLSGSILSVDFSQTREATEANVATRRQALEYLSGGGAIGGFPAGAVSTAATPFARPMDSAWKPFTARMILRSGAMVVPVHFGGHNSRLFQVASHLNYTLRMGLMIREFRSRIGKPLQVCIGTAVPRSEIEARAHSPHLLMAYLRETTYRLSPEPIDDLGLGLNLG